MIILLLLTDVLSQVLLEGVVFLERTLKLKLEVNPLIGNVCRRQYDHNCLNSSEQLFSEPTRQTKSQIIALGNTFMQEFDNRSEHRPLYLNILRRLIDEYAVYDHQDQVVAFHLDFDLPTNDPQRFNYVLNTHSRIANYFSTKQLAERTLTQDEILVQLQDFSFRKVSLKEKSLPDHAKHQGHNGEVRYLSPAPDSFGIIKFSSPVFLNQLVLLSLQREGKVEMQRSEKLVRVLTFPKLKWQNLSSRDEQIDTIRVSSDCLIKLLVVITLKQKSFSAEQVDAYVIDKLGSSYIELKVEELAELNKEVKKETQKSGKGTSKKFDPIIATLITNAKMEDLKRINELLLLILDAIGVMKESPEAVLKQSEILDVLSEIEESLDEDELYEFYHILKYVRSDLPDEASIRDTQTRLQMIISNLEGYKIKEEN